LPSAIIAKKWRGGEGLNKTVINERLKLLAAWFNTVAAAFLTTGIVAPIVAIIYDLTPKTPDPTLVFVSSSICILFSGGLHLTGSYILGALQE
jgi:ABC-type transport system involved in multi-copper enzyme maturation permease subunit